MRNLGYPACRTAVSIFFFSLQAGPCKRTELPQTRSRYVRRVLGIRESSSLLLLCHPLPWLFLVIVLQRALWRCLKYSGQKTLQLVGEMRSGIIGYFGQNRKEGSCTLCASWLNVFLSLYQFLSLEVSRRNSRLSRPWSVGLTYDSTSSISNFNRRRLWK